MEPTPVWCEWNIGENYSTLVMGRSRRQVEYGGKKMLTITMVHPGEDLSPSYSTQQREEIGTS